MCGRFTLATPPQIVAEFFELPAVPDLQPRYNIAPTQGVPAVVVTLNEPERRLQLFRWGLIPASADDPSIGNRMINARAETAAEKPAFREAFRRRRCLVIADGFYEWQKLPKRKQPFYVRMRDAKPFAFAGLWDCWRKGDEPIRSCTLLTCPPNELVASMHDRMPVILDPNNYAVWLDPQVTEEELLASLLAPFPAERMTGYPVSTRVNAATQDDPACIEPMME